MNITFFNPRYFNFEKFNDLINALNISDIYSFLPYDQTPKNCDKITLHRKRNESIDEAIRRGVYKFVNMIKIPIVISGELTGEFYVQDLYTHSNWLNYEQNLSLEDPNILVLKSERSSINFMQYIFNILNKHGSIDYSKRICRSKIDQFITLEYNDIICSPNSPISIISKDLYISNPNNLAEYFLTEIGIKKRLEQIDEIKWEEEWWRKELLAINNAERWQETLDAEMGYIESNGGDWIDY